MPKREGEEEGDASQKAPRLVVESLAEIAEAAVTFGDIEVDNDEITLESTSWKCTHETCKSYDKERVGGMKEGQPDCDAHKAICEHI